MPVAGAPDGGRPVVRFAPSPTGYFHVGSARTALFNWMFARKTGGRYLLRIEDTDTERNQEHWVDGIVSALRWLGLEPDEPPVRQSGRQALYDDAVARLLASGHLYACDCTREQVEERTRGNAVPGYDGFCRDRGLDPAGRALRFDVPDEGTTVVADIVRGAVEFPNESIEDFVVVKSNGGPLFVLANVVDDIDMGITHVIRGVDLLPSAPKALLLWRALMGEAATLPAYAHLPLLVNEQRRKISKRRDRVAVEEYRAEGYLAEAFCNFLALLGWSHPEGAEIFDVADVVDRFALEDVNHAPAFFDVAKLRHVNGARIRAMDVDQFVEACRPWLVGEEMAIGHDLEAAIVPGGPPWPSMHYDESVFRRLAPATQERVTRLGEVPELVDFAFLEAPVTDHESWELVAADPTAAAVLDAAVDEYATVAWEAAALHERTGALVAALGLSLSKGQRPIRVAVTGRTKGLPLFESLEVLGRDCALRRLRAARQRLGSA